MISVPGPLLMVAASGGIWYRRASQALRALARKSAGGDVLLKRELEACVHGEVPVVHGSDAVLEELDITGDAGVAFGILRGLRPSFPG